MPETLDIHHRGPRGVAQVRHVEEMVDALREYAEDWQDHLREAPNHRDNWGLVQLISLSDDDQVRDWLAGDAR